MRRTMFVVPAAISCLVQIDGWATMVGTGLHPVKALGFLAALVILYALTGVGMGLLLLLHDVRQFHSRVNGRRNPHPGLYALVMAEAILAPWAVALMQLLTLRARGRWIAMGCPGANPLFG